MCFTQEDQHPSSVVNGLVSLGVSEQDIIIEDVITILDTEEWEDSGDEPKVPYPSQALRLKPDAKLIHVLSNVLEDLGLEWYLLGSCQQSSHQCPALFLPGVHDALTKTWRAP